MAGVPAFVPAFPPTLTNGERRLVNFAQQTRSLMMLTDLEGRVIWANEAVTQTSGFNLDELVGHTPGEVLQGPGTDPKTVRTMAEALSRGRGFEVEVLNYTKDGRAYWIDLEVQPVYDDAGNVVEFVSIGHDITRRKLAELGEHKREREAHRLAMVAALISNAVVITDAAGYIEWVNASFTRMSGYTLEEVLGRRPGSLLHGPQTDARAVERMRAAVIAREGCEVEVVNYTKLGRAYRVAIEIRPIVDEDTRAVSGFIAIETDVTDQRNTEAAAEKSAAEARELATIADLLDTALAVEELDGTLRYVNAAWLKLYGYRRGEVIARRAQDVLDGPDTDRDLRRKADAACSRGEPMIFRIANYRKDGQPLPVIVERRPVRDRHGLINRVVSIVRPETRGEPLALAGEADPLSD